nr:hypothetical protein [Tanacetum cinerariifolium]
MPPKPLRKQKSGYQKRLEKQKTEQSNKHGSNVDDAGVHGGDVNVDSNEIDGGDVNVDSNEIDDTNIESTSVDDDGFDEIDVDNMNVDNPNANFHIDIFDPRNWDGLSSDMIKVLVERGPKRDHSINKGPKDRLSRRFSATFFTRVLPNNEKCGREWLVYSKELDRIHLSTRLKEHEVGIEHITNMVTWFDMRHRLKKNETIDKVAHEQFEKERDHWMKVLFRIVFIVKFLDKHTLAFRGTNEKLHVNSNGDFWV